jgi:hypothetical protein
MVFFIDIDAQHLLFLYKIQEEEGDMDVPLAIMSASVRLSFEPPLVCSLSFLITRDMKVGTPPPLFGCS